MNQFSPGNFWRILGFFQVALLFALSGKSQVVVGNWTFNNVLTGTPGANNTVSSASLGSAIVSSAYNGGTVFFGEDGWPTGGIDPNAYLQFTLTPNSGYGLNLSSIDFNIRRSTTGTPPGSGPQNWALRSSIDGYASNITTAVLTQSTTPTVTVTLGAPFNMLTSAITFRLYGYNSATTSGGLNRFVFDNIAVKGLYVLPMSMDELSGNLLGGDAVQIRGAVYNAPNAFNVYVQRSVDLIHFTTIDSLYTSMGDQQISYTDRHLPNAANIYYRLAVNQGHWIYSQIISIKNLVGENFDIGHFIFSGSKITVQVNAGKRTSARLSIISIDGKMVRQKTILLEKGSQRVEMEGWSLPGVYFMKLDYGSGSSCAKFIR
ncbi:MAG: hypothetical protein C5B52_03985 [Bacteroidetes bacterium]|nr:MAG: hypothetical protein C5B52_03985 [Bacteroidota bacterium]